MTLFLPAPLLMHAWRNERSLKDNCLVKCIHYTGEEFKRNNLFVGILEMPLEMYQEMSPCTDL